MTAAQPPSSGPYSVHASAAVIQSLRDLSDEAHRRGLGEAYAAALRDLYARLREDAQNCGELRYRLHALGLSMRHMMGPVIYAQFAVSEERRAVYLREVRLSQDRPADPSSGGNGQSPPS